MPFATPSFSQLQATVIAEILASGQVPNGLLPVAMLRILGQCVANNAYLHTEFLRWISLQAVPATATDEFLDAWASIVSVIRYPASGAIGSVQFTGTDGTDIPLGTQISRVGDDTVYATLADATIASGVATVSVQAVIPGASTNGATGLAATLGSVITGVSSSVVFTTAASGGADAELDPSLRTRMLAAFARVGSAGSISDYEQWALSPGVTRVFVSPWGFGYGTVVIYIMLDVQNAANNGFPLGTDGVSSSETRWAQGVASGDQLNWANAIFPNQPIAAVVFVASPVPYHLSLNINNLSISASTTVQANILAAIQGYLLSVGTPLGCTV